MTPWYRRPWVWALGGLIAVAAIAVGVVFAAGSDDGESGARDSTPGITSPSATVPANTVPSAGNEPPPPTGRYGSLETAEGDLYPLLPGSLARLGAAQVTARSVPLLSVVGKEVFWAGESKTKRILVHVRTKGRPPPALRGKKKVDFIGQLLPNTANAARTFGVTEPAGAALLARQRAHIEVSIADLLLS